MSNDNKGGVWGESTHDFWNTEYAIFSIDGEDNWAARAAFDCFLTGLNIPYKRLEGCYKGVKEHSWIVKRHDFDILRLKTYFTDGQESVLIVSKSFRDPFAGRFTPTRNAMVSRATLHFLADGREVDLGILRPVSQKVALQEEAYTYCPLTGLYWVAVQPVEVRKAA